MLSSRILVSSMTLALLCAPAFAQGTQPAKPATPAPAAAPSTSTNPAKTWAATAPIAAKVNLNTAAAADLEKLPQVGPARSKAIVEARTTAKFKNWDDFVARKVVPADVAALIKDRVAF
jgi:competence protein ComEA